MYDDLRPGNGAVGSAHNDVGVTGPTAIQRSLAALPGVDDVVIDHRGGEGKPLLRIQLDGSCPADEVEAAIRRALHLIPAIGSAPRPDLQFRPEAVTSLTGFPAGDSAGARGSGIASGASYDSLPGVGGPTLRAKSEEPLRRERRRGLGRGLGELFTAVDDTRPPVHLQPATPSPTDAVPGRLALVAVEETAGGIAVRTADDRGQMAFAPVTAPDSLNRSIVAAVSYLAGVRPVPVLEGVEVRDIGVAAVLTVVLRLGDGRRSVGAALIDTGMPFTLGRAVWEALREAAAGAERIP